MPTVKSFSKSSKNSVPDSAPTRRGVPAGLADTIPVGKILRPHGLRGQTIVAVDSSLAEMLTVGVEVLILIQGTSRRLVVCSTRPHRRGCVLGFDGIDSREQAEELREAIVQLSRGSLPVPCEGEYYDFELIGCRVVTTGGDEIGTVIEIIVTGANDVCVVRGGSGESLLPMIAAAVIRLDPTERRIVVDAAALVPPGP